MTEKIEGCGCYECVKNDVDENGTSVLLKGIITCPLCGNRRCPKATSHENACTGSDDPWQEGSRYNWKIPKEFEQTDPNYIKPTIQPLPDQNE